MNMKKILEMKAKREDTRLKAMAVLNKAEAEDRFLSEEEQKNIDKYEEEIRAWDESIGRAEKLLAIEPEDRSTEKPEVKPTPAKDTEKRFSSFGEQLMAAYRAAMPGGKVDERLSTRAASGLNETTPSDGGFLVQQDFVTELLKRTYETGILASKVKKIPISTNANGMKINAIDEDSRANGSRWGGVQTYWRPTGKARQTNSPQANPSSGRWNCRLKNSRVFAMRPMNSCRMRRHSKPLFVRHSQKSSGSRLTMPSFRVAARANRSEFSTAVQS